MRSEEEFEKFISEELKEYACRAEVPARCKAEIDARIIAAEPDQKKPLAKEVLAAIREYLSCRPGASAAEPLFTSTGNRSGGKRLAPSTISTQLKNALRQAGFNSNRITAHSLRHTAGTSVQELTGNIYLTQVYMRHSNPATTEIYLHNNTDQAEAAIAQRLYEYYHAGEKDDAAEK